MKPKYLVGYKKSPQEEVVDTLYRQILDNQKLLNNKPIFAPVEEKKVKKNTDDHKTSD